MREARECAKMELGAQGSSLEEEASSTPQGKGQRSFPRRRDFCTWVVKEE